MKKILVIGANSAIAKECARLWAGRGDRLFLVGRQAEALESLASDLRVRGASHIGLMALDLNRLDQHEKVLLEAQRELGGLDLCLIAHGTLSDQKACEKSVDLSLKEISTNALSQISFMTHLANLFETKQSGQLAVISSVAGDRGRASNYVYGSSKAMVSSFASGLRQRLASSQVSVLTIKPGFVDTPMTQHLKKGILWAQPADIARAIVKSVDEKRDVLYVPCFWWAIMRLICAIPERVFKKLKL